MYSFYSGWTRPIGNLGEWEGVFRVNEIVGTLSEYGEAFQESQVLAGQVLMSKEIDLELVDLPRTL